MKPFTSFILVFWLMMALMPAGTPFPGGPAKAAPAADSGLPASLQYTARGHGLNFQRGEWFVSNGTYALGVSFEGARAVFPQGKESLRPAGQGAAPLEQVVYANLWDGVTVTYRAVPNGVVESTFTIAANADPQAIRWRYNAPVQLNEDGTLAVRFETGKVIESAPVAWQQHDGARYSVDVRYALENGAVRFVLGDSDSSLPLYIDPTLTWNTFLGGGGTDSVSDIAVDSLGNVYVIGGSTSGWGTPRRAYTSGWDAFVARLDSAGTLKWNTFLGGSDSDDLGNGLTMDSQGNLFVTGESSASWGTPQRAYTSDRDGFVAKLNVNGALKWNTFLGGGGEDKGAGVSWDDSGNLYVTGGSTAVWGTPLRAFMGDWDAFVVRLNSAQGEVQWNMFLGADTFDSGTGIAVDDSGIVYVTGTSYATWGTPRRAFSGGHDAFVAKIKSNGNLKWNTFLGSGGGDQGSGIAVDGSGDMYVAGDSGETWGAPRRPYSGEGDAFVAKINSKGILKWNTFLGGSATDDGYGHDQGGEIAVDDGGTVYVTGTSDVPWGTPRRPYSGEGDAFVAKLNGKGRLKWNTFLGGGLGKDRGGGIAVDDSGNVYVTGFSNATWGTPIRAFTGGDDGIVVKIRDR